MTVLEQPAEIARFKHTSRRSGFLLKLTNWEYWPMYISNLPVFFIGAWFALRARRLFFFTAVNPAIETGGMWGESKFNILKRIPSTHVPATLFIKQGTAFEEVITRMEDIGLDYPVIAKPNVGERGFLVSKIHHQEELRVYIRKNSVDFLIQKFIELPLELAVMHHRYPGWEAGAITSICIKETLKVTGDGNSTVRQLMEANPRASLQLTRFENEFPEVLSKILPSGQTLELEPIGNHCRGTKFLNGNRHIDEQLNAVFNQVAVQMDDIFYGRFDLKCQSMEDLRNGGNFQVMEYNGVGAEPAHIYDPAYPVFRKYRDIYRHWRIMYRIYKIQKRRKVKSMTLPEAITSLKLYLNYKKRLAE